MTPEEVQLLIIGKQRATARSKIADHLLKKYNLKTTSDTKEILAYKDGHFQNIGEDIVATETKHLMGVHCTSGDINEIINAHIKPQTFTDRKLFNNDLTRTCLENGVLNLETGELEPHSPDHMFTFKMNVSYDPEAECKNIIKFLEEVTLAPLDIQTIFEVFAYCLYRKYPKAKVIVLIGSGRNGKSTLLSLLKKFLGRDNIRSLSMQQLEHNQFAKIHLFGKHANINPDIGNKKIECNGVIKQLTGSDEVDCDVKFKGNAKFENFAKLIFGTNDLPTSDDTSDAWNSRWIFLKFPHKFMEGKICPRCRCEHNVIPELDTILEKELPGLLNEVLKAYKRLKENNWNFTQSEETRLMEDEYHTISDPVAGFIKDCIVEEERASVPKKEIHDAYRNFCQDIGEQPLAGNQFSVRFKQLLSGVTETRSGRQRKWVGIKLRETDIQSGLDNIDNPNGGLSKSAWGFSQ